MVNRRLADTVSALQGLSLGCISYQKSSNHKLSGFGRLKSSPAPRTPPPQPSNTKVWLSSQGGTQPRSHPGTCSRAEPNTPHVLVSPWGTLPGVLGLPPQSQCLGPAECGRRADLLLLVTVDPLQNGLLGLQRLSLCLCLRRHSYDNSSVSTARICRTSICSPACPNGPRLPLSCNSMNRSSPSGPRSLIQPRPTPKRPRKLKFPPSLPPQTNQSPTSPTDRATHSIPSSLNPLQTPGVPAPTPRPTLSQVTGLHPPVQASPAPPSTCPRPSTRLKPSTTPPPPSARLPPPPRTPAPRRIPQHDRPLQPLRPRRRPQPSPSFFALGAILARRKPKGVSRPAPHGLIAPNLARPSPSPLSLLPPNSRDTSVARREW